jgi:hypothetical protein
MLDEKMILQPELSEESQIYLGLKKSKKERFNLLFPKMSEEDREESLYMFFSVGPIRGIGKNEQIIIGSEKSIKRYNDFQDLMLEKYGV